MHMANELLSVPVAAGTILITSGGIVAVCKKAKETLTHEKLPLMGIMGAFVFAAQMVNFPILTGTSGHMVGAVLLAIILGPHAGAIVMTSIVIVQCLIFQDGGLLALGCNIINMGLVPTYLGYYIFRLFSRDGLSRGRIYAGSIIACLAAVEAGAVLVPIQAWLSGVLQVPFTTFLATMLGVHLLVGLVEGVITAFVLGYLREVRPEIVACGLSGQGLMSAKAVYVTLLAAALLLAAGLSLVASSNPDGLEWSYKERPDQPDFAPSVQNDSPVIAAADRLQERFTPMPDYSVRAAEQSDPQAHDIASAEPWAGWTSFAGVLGSILTMAVIWLVARLLRGRHVPAVD
jgi:cobalt/nickel transport system permease protein